MYKVYYNDAVNEPSLLYTCEKLSSAFSYCAKYVNEKVLVDEEHNCSDDVFMSSAVAHLEIYDGALIKTDIQGNMSICNPIAYTEYFYKD